MPQELGEIFCAVENHHESECRKAHNRQDGQAPGPDADQSQRAAFFASGAQLAQGSKPGNQGGSAQQDGSRVTNRGGQWNWNNTPAKRNKCEECSYKAEQCHAIGWSAGRDHVHLKKKDRPRAIFLVSRGEEI